ncbi:MAG: 2-amino-4-hydroxy-6-hydroxymethyldihydropteridine diphosphokinase [Thermoanaerobaculia bacterium]
MTIDPGLPVPAILSIGSNLGDRRMNLRRAVAHLGEVSSPVRVSRIYVTEPVDSPPGAGDFFNLAVLTMTTGSPFRFLERLLGIEVALGRRRSVRNAPRVIDLDLIMFGAAVVRSRELTLPHPRFRERNFVLEPMRELVPEWCDPVSGKRIKDLEGAGEARRLGSLY